MSDRTASSGSWTAATGPATPALLRTINDRSALELLLDRGPQSRIDIGRLTGLSKPTASQTLARLEASGRVVRVGVSTGRPGPAAQLYDLNPVAGYAAAADVTPTRATVVIADLTGRVVGEASVAMRRRPVKHRRAAVGSVACSGAPGRHHRGRGRRAHHRPARCVQRGRGWLRYAAHMPGWHDKQLLERLAEALRCPSTSRTTSTSPRWPSSAAVRHEDVPDFVYCWAGEGIGRRSCWRAGCAEAPPEEPARSASCPCRVPAWCAGSPAANAGGFHDQRGQGRRACAWHAAVASSAAPLRTSWPRLRTDRAPTAACWTSWRPATRPASPPWSASSTRHSWCWPVPFCVPGESTLRTRVARELGELAMVSPALAVSTVAAARSSPAPSTPH